MNLLLGTYENIFKAQLCTINAASQILTQYFEKNPVNRNGEIVNLVNL